MSKETQKIINRIVNRMNELEIQEIYKKRNELALQNIVSNTSTVSFNPSISHIPIGYPWSF